MRIVILGHPTNVLLLSDTLTFPFRPTTVVFQVTHKWGYCTFGTWQFQNDASQDTTDGATPKLSP